MSAHSHLESPDRDAGTADASDRILHGKLARDLHLEDRLTRTAAKQNDLASMLHGNTVREGKPKSGTFLFSFAHEGLKEARTNALRNAGTVVDYIDDHLTLLRLQSDHHLG